MIRVEIPGWRTLTLETLVLDLNGTIAVNGQVLRLSAGDRVFAARSLRPGNRRARNERWGRGLLRWRRQRQIQMRSRYPSARVLLPIV